MKLLPWPRRGPRRQGLQPTVEWQVCGACNYNCSYCIQSPRHRTGSPSAEQVDAVIGQLAHLPGTWEIKISGGEPFSFEGFIQRVVPGLMQRTPHLVSVLTNFSAPAEVLERFCRITGPRLRITSSSFHPDRVQLESFVRKALAYRELRRRHCPDSSFVVNVVLVPGQLQRHLRIRDLLRQEGLRYYPQLMKITGGVYPYDRADGALIERLTGGSHDPHEVNRAPSYRGQHCEAGRWYFVVDRFGEAYPCRSARRFAEAGEGLGNLAHGDLTLRPRGGPCPFSSCPCSVPFNRGMVQAGAGP